MTLPTWDMLSKNATDPETIEEAISRLISEHNDDVVSHTDTGQSLEVHRADGIVDHPAGSILADKWSMRDFSIDENFKDISVYDIIGDVSNYQWPSLNLAIEYGTTNKSELKKEIEIPSPYLSINYDQLFQVTAYFDTSNVHFNAWLGIGFEDELPNNGYGFVVTDGVLTAGVAYAGSRTFSSAISVDITVAHVYRAQLSAQEGLITFFIDGSQVAQIAVPGTDWNTDDGPHLGIRVTVTNDGNMVCGDMFFARSVISTS